jgi:hypothetical protein
MREEVKRDWWDGSIVNELEAMVNESEASLIGGKASREH